MKYIPVQNNMYKDLKIVGIDLPKGMCDLSNMMQFSMKAYGNFQTEKDNTGIIIDPVNEFLTTLSEVDNNAILSYLVMAHTLTISAALSENPYFKIYASDEYTKISKVLITKLQSDFVKLDESIQLRVKIKQHIEGNVQLSELLCKFAESMSEVVKEFKKIHEKFNKKDVIELMKLSLLSKILSPVFGSILNVYPSRHDICATIILGTQRQNITVEKMKQYVFFNVTKKLNSIKDDLISNTFEAHVQTSDILNSFVVKNMVNSSLTSELGNILTYFIHSSKREIWNITKKYKKSM